MTTNYDKNSYKKKRSHKPEFILLIGVLVMQVAIFIAIINSRKPTYQENRQLNRQNLDTTKAIKQNQAPTNHIISPFSVMDRDMAFLMNELFKSPRQSQYNNQQHHIRMVQSLNNAMRDMAFFSDLMNIDNGWDMVNISPAMDMREKEHSYEIMVSVPGGTESNVIVELNGQLLNIYIPIQISTPEYNECRTYQQQILIPGPISTNTAMTATISNNILRVILPKGNRISSHTDHTKLL